MPSPRKRSERTPSPSPSPPRAPQKQAHNCNKHPWFALRREIELVSTRGDFGFWGRGVQRLIQWATSSGVVSIIILLQAVVVVVLCSSAGAAGNNMSVGVGMRISNSGLVALLVAALLGWLLRCSDSNFEFYLWHQSGAVWWGVSRYLTLSLAS